MSELDDIQRKAVEDLDDGKLLVGQMGSGKSRVAAAYYFANHLDRDVYVITTAKKRDSLDWQEEFAGFAIGTVPEISYGGVLKVDSWNQIDQYVDVEGAFFIFDEQRAVGRGKWAKSFVKIARNNCWILLSATPGDTWIDYIPVFVANGFYRNPTEFKAEHVIYNHHAKFPKVDRYVGQARLNRYRNSILVEMPVIRHTTWHTEIVRTEHDATLLEKVVKDRWNVFEERPLRDAAELFTAMRKVVNSSESRLDQVSKLLTKHTRLIVFYNFDYELEMLRTLASPQRSESGTQSLETTSKGKSFFRESSTISLPRESSPMPASASKNQENLTSRSSTISPVSPESERENDYWNTGSVLNQRSQNGGETNTAVVAAPGRSNDSRDASTLSSSVAAPGSFQIAEWNGHKHEPIPDTDSWIYLVQYTAGSEGWNCVLTDAMVFFSLTYSYKQFHQSYGRIDRRNTPFNDLYYYILMSDSMIDKAIWKALSGKRSFHESAFKVNFKHAA